MDVEHQNLPWNGVVGNGPSNELPCLRLHRCKRQLAGWCMEIALDSYYHEHTCQYFVQTTIRYQAPWKTAKFQRMLDMIEVDETEDSPFIFAWNRVG